MKIKAIGGKLERVPGGLNVNLVNALMGGKEVEVDSIPHKLEGLVETVDTSSKNNLNKTNKVEVKKGDK
tara:strand:+ start:715 stop:921 length:207 start_codon:yes stop_codon:yes gene_type:complete